MSFPSDLSELTIASFDPDHPTCKLHWGQHAMLSEMPSKELQITKANRAVVSTPLRARPSLRDTL